MEATKDDMKKEIGYLYMEDVMLRQALSEEQQEIAKLTTEVGSLRQRHARLSQAARVPEECAGLTLNINAKRPVPFSSASASSCLPPAKRVSRLQ